MNQDSADFRDLKSAHKTLVDGLPEGLSFSEKLPIFTRTFGLSLDDFKKHGGPSRDTLDQWKSGSVVPNGRKFDSLLPSTKKALRDRDFEAATAERAAKWLVRGSPANKKAPIEPEGTTEAVASQVSPREAGSPAPDPLSDYLRECDLILEATREALDWVEQAQAYQVALDGLGTLNDKERRDQLRLATWHRWHWQGLHKDTVRQVEEQADRVLEIDEDIERLNLPENLVEAAFRLDHLEEIRPQEARLLELRDGLQSTRRLAMEVWAAVADRLRLETEIALYKRALADMSGQERVSA